MRACQVFAWCSVEINWIVIVHGAVLNKSSAEKIVFIHLTKTAGGTLKEAIMAKENICPHFVYLAEDWGKYDASLTDVIYGHPGKWLFGNIGSSFGEQGRFSYVVFLRHPVIRTISHYYHLYNVEEGQVGEKIRQFKDINEFFAHGYHWEFENYFCRILSNHQDVRNKEDMADKFSAAMEVLRAKIDFVGFQEYFSLSLFRLNQKLGLGLNPPRSINVGSYSLANVSDETIQLIEDMNVYDLRLYREMLSGFLTDYYTKSL